MSKYNGEQVFAWPLDKVNTFLDNKQGFVPASEFDKAEIFKHENGVFLDRDLAEADETHKQLIPYCVLVCGKNVLNYTRGKSGGESRLHAKISVGVGGHINPSEGAENFYLKSLFRELGEELNLPPEFIVKSSTIGVLNDDSDPVGKVHLGVAHILHLKNEGIGAKEDCLANLTFTHIDELNGPLFDRLEGWSKLVIRELAKPSPIERAVIDPTNRGY